MTAKNRPFSAESRMAWEPEDGGVVNPAGTQFDEDDMVPSAMESELYTKKSQAMALPGKVGQLQPAANQSLGCWGNFKKGVRCKTQDTVADSLKHSPCKAGQKSSSLMP